MTQEAASYVRATGRVRSKKKKKMTEKSRPTQTHHEIHSSPATTTNSRRRATQHVPLVSPFSPASIDPGFVEIGLVQLSQSWETTNVTHTDRHTARPIKWWHPVRTPVWRVFFAWRQKRPRSLCFFGLASILGYSCTSVGIKHVFYRSYIVFRICLAPSKFEAPIRSSSSNGGSGTETQFLLDPTTTQGKGYHLHMALGVFWIFTTRTTFLPSAYFWIGVGSSLQWVLLLYVCDMQHP